jgi:hypothetical protein
MVIGLNCIALSMTFDIQNLIQRFVLGYWTIITLTLIVLLNIETLAIFKVLNPKASKWFVTIFRCWMIMTGSLCVVLTSWNYYLLAKGITTMEQPARLSRMVHGFSILLSVQILVIYWLILVRTTLKKKPTGELGGLLRSAQLYVISICLICLSGNAIYFVFELIPYEDPRKVFWILWPSILSAIAITPMFRLFLTMIQIKLTESKWKDYTPNGYQIENSLPLAQKSPQPQPSHGKESKAPRYSRNKV